MGHVLNQVLDNIVLLLILVGIGLLVSVKQWPEWFRRARSANWPATPGIIESGEVSTIRGRSGYTYRATETATARLGYSYQLDGTYHSGYHIETFDDEQEAWSYVDSLKGKVVEVSYDPRKPDVSVLGPAAIALLDLAPPPPAQSPPVPPTLVISTPPSQQAHPNCDFNHNRRPRRRPPR